MEKGIHIFSVSIVIIPTRLLCQVLTCGHAIFFFWRGEKISPPPPPRQKKKSPDRRLVKCKRTLLELNFYQLCPSSWREWILSLLDWLGIFTGSREVDGKEMYKTVWCTCKVFCLVKLLLIWLSRRGRILNFLLFTISCNKSKTEYSRGKLNCSCW